MRLPFIVEIKDRNANPNSNLLWHELTPSPLGLHVFFDTVLTIAAVKAVTMKGYEVPFGDTHARAQQRPKVADMIGYNSFPGPGIHWVLPAASTVLPSVRLVQNPTDTPKGLSGMHIGMLYERNAGIVGLAILQRQGQTSEAKISVWKHPFLSSHKFFGAVKALMNWSRDPAHAGFRDFVAHVQADIPNQIGNMPAVNFASKLGFKMESHPAADTQKTSSAVRREPTCIFRASGWEP